MFRLSGFADEISGVLDEQVKTLKEAGLDFLEFRSVEGVNVLDMSDSQISGIKRVLRDNGIGVSAIGSPLGKSNIDEPESQVLEKTKRILEIANMLETKYVRVFSFFMPDGSSPETYRAEVVDRLAAMTALAEKSERVLVHENERGIYGDTSARCKDFLLEINSPNLRACFDPGNSVMVLGEGTAYNEFLEIMNFLEYFHAKDATYSQKKFVPVGEGDGCIRKILNTLVSENWNGFLSVEPHLTHHLPDLEPHERFLRAVHALNKELSECK